MTDIEWVVVVCVCQDYPTEMVPAWDKNIVPQTSQHTARGGITMHAKWDGFSAVRFQNRSAQPNKSGHAHPKLKLQWVVLMEAS